jgi:hypothetical protein
MFSSTATVHAEAGQPFGAFRTYPIDGGTCAYVEVSMSTDQPYSIVVEKSGYRAVRVSNVWTAVRDCSDPTPLPSPEEVHVVLEPS